MSTKRSAIYGRVSTDEQAGKGKLSLPQQIAKGEAYAELHDLEVVDVYREDFTGTKPMEKRPEGARLMAAVRAGKVDVVVFWKLDRVGRSARVILNTFGDIEDAGAALVLVDEGIDTSTAVGRAFRTILAAFAELERDSILTRTGAARYGLSQAGVFPGSPIPFGYYLSEDRRTFLVDEDEATTVRRAYELRLEGLSMVEVAKRLTAEGHRTRARNYTDKTTGETTTERRPWRTSRTTKLIASEWYKGEAYTLPVRLDPLDPDSLEPFSWAMPELVSSTVWAKANTRRSALPKNAGQNRNVYGLPNVYHDHGDGERVTMHGSTRTGWKGRKDREYICNAGRTDGETGAAPHCPGFGDVQKGTPTVRAKADRVEALTLHYMLGLLQNTERLAALRDEADQREAARDIEAEVEAAQERRDGLLRRREFVTEDGADAAEAGVLDRESYARRLAGIDSELADATEDLDVLRAERDGVERERKSIEDLVADLVVAGDDDGLTFEDYVVDFTTEGKSPSRPPKRLSDGWTFVLLDEVAKALTLDNRGATPPLSDWAVSETRHLAERLGIVVVLTRNDEGKNPARWPDVGVALGPDSPFVRLDSVPEQRHGDGSSPLDQRGDDHLRKSGSALGERHDLVRSRHRDSVVTTPG